jgi:hypothetical protein
MDARQRKVVRVLELFRHSTSPGDLVKKDWSSLRVAARLVYETEDLRMFLHRKRQTDRYFIVDYWLDSMEGGFEFMRWTKCLATITTETTYAKERREIGIEALWDQHRELAKRLLSPKVSPCRRLSLLVELGGIELSLMGHLWWLESSNEETVAGPRNGERRKAKAVLKRSSTKSKRT